MGAPKKDKKDKFAPLLALPSHKLQFINDLIFKESKITRAIEVLQDDYGIFKEYTKSTMRVYLHAYKAEFKEAWYTFNLDGSTHSNAPIPAELLENIPKEVGDPKLAQWIPYGQVKVLLAEAVTKFDAMTELERVTLMQYERVIKLMEYERQLPTEYIDKEGKKRPALGLHKEGKTELELMSRMLRDLVNLQMDLGIRNKIEKAEQHLHVNLDPYQQQLLKDVRDMQVVSDVTTRALEIITGSSRITNTESSGENVLPNPSE